MCIRDRLLGERQVKPGDEMITVAAGFPTTVTPAIQYGVVPVFIDVTIPQYNICLLYTSHLRKSMKQSEIHGMWMRNI